LGRVGVECISLSTTGKKEQSSMNRAWKTGLALGGVLGSAGAAYAGVSAGIEQTTKPADANAAVAAVQHMSARVVSYQVGAAGTVQLTSTDGVLTVSSATAAGGWTLLSTTSPGAHVEVQFTDGLQLVTFGADAGEGGITVALSNVPAPGAPTTTAAAAPMDVTVITTPPVVTNAPPPAPATPAPAPAPTPAPTTPHTTQPAPVTTQPPPASTTAPSSGGGDDDHDDDHGDDHGGDDHEEPSDD